MANLIHIVGPQGSCKPFLAESLAAGMQLSAPSTRVRILDPDDALRFTNAKARALQVSTVIVLAECLEPRHKDLAPDDYLITVTRGSL